MRRRQESRPPDGSPRQWRFTPAVWRGSRQLSRRQVDLLLRFRSGSVVPGAADRFVAMGLPAEIVDQTLNRVRSLEGWADVWTWTAQRFMGDARQRTVSGESRPAAEARRLAALSYHAATTLVLRDLKKARALRSASVTLFAQAAPVVLPAVLRVDVTWRTRRLPGFLVRPVGDSQPPLLVVLNGATTAKEELIGWADRFLDHGIGYLALDWPGTGDAPRMDTILDDTSDDLTDGLFHLAGSHGFDPGRISLLGVGIGGALAVQATAADRRIAACVAVSAPFDAARWIRSMHPLLSRQLVGASEHDEGQLPVVERFALAEAAERLRAPLLVFGAGRDMVVPPGEAMRLASAVGDLATLVWYPNGHHALYDYVNSWTDDAAQWLSEVLGVKTTAGSTRLESLALTQRSEVVVQSDPTP